MYESRWKDLPEYYTKECILTDATLKKAHPGDRTESLLKGQTMRGYPHTSVHLVVPEFNKEGPTSILSFRDGHSAHGQIELVLSNWDKPSQSWHRTSQYLHTTPPTGTSNNDPAITFRKPSTVTVNVQEYPARHLTQLIYNYDAHRMSGKSIERLAEDRLWFEESDPSLALVAEQMMSALVTAGRAQGRTPSWPGAPVPSDKEVEVEAVTST